MDGAIDKNWFGTKPDISNLRIFGSVAYVHIPKVERKKLDSKSISCLLVGYCTTQKAYRFWDQVARRTRISRDAIFNKQVSITTRDGMTLFDLIASEPENEVPNAGNDAVCDPMLIDEHLSDSSK